MNWLTKISSRKNVNKKANVANATAPPKEAVILPSPTSSTTGLHKSLSSAPEVPPVAKEKLTPAKIIELSHLFWPSRVLLVAVEIGLFTRLAQAPRGGLTNAEICHACGFHPRTTPDFTDCLVSLDLLCRDGDDPHTAVYRNSPESALFLDQARDSYIGKILEVASKKLYRDWADHPQLLKDKTRQTDKLRNVIDVCNREARVRLFYSGRVGSTGVTAEEKKLSPARIYDLGFGFWNSRILLTAIEWRLFTTIEATPKRRMTADQIRKEYDLRKSTVVEFLDSLVSFDMLRKEDVPQAEGTTKVYYLNTAAGALFLDRQKPSYVGGIMEMLSNRGYPMWADLLEAFRTGETQGEAKTSTKGSSLFEVMHQTPALLEEFTFAMIGISHGAFDALAHGTAVDFAQYRTLCDIGGGAGQLACYVTRAHPHLTAVTTDLPSMLPIAQRWIQNYGGQERVTPVVNDFFEEDFPKADVITMAMILHDWNLERKKTLIRKAYEALPEGGALVSIEMIIDDERRENTMGLCMSLHMLIEFGADGGFDFTGADFDSWCKEAGFRRTEVRHLLGPTSAAIAYK